MESFYRDAETMVRTMQAHINREEETVFPFMEEHLGEEADGFVYKQYEDYILKNFPPDFYATTEEHGHEVAGQDPGSKILSEPRKTVEMKRRRGRDLNSRGMNSQ